MKSVLVTGSSSGFGREVAVMLGADDVAASWLARVAPYAVRRRGVEYITGIDGRRPAPTVSTVTGSNEPKERSHPTWDE